MSLARFLMGMGCALLALSGWILQNAPRGAVIDLCPWFEQLSRPCPAWGSSLSLPETAPWALYAVAGLGFLGVLWPALRGSPAPPEKMLAQYIQRGRDLHERCRKEGDQAVLPDIAAWTEEVSEFLRRLGHRYVVSFGDFGDIQLFASQYDTAATLEIRRRIQRLTEFMQRFREGEGHSD